MNRTTTNAKNALRAGRGLLALPGTGASASSCRSEPALASCATTLEICCCSAAARPLEPAARAASIFCVSEFACAASCARSATVRTLRNVSATPLAICAERLASPSLAVMLTMFALASSDVVTFCWRLVGDAPSFRPADASTVGEVTYAWSVAKFSCEGEPDAAPAVASTEGAIFAAVAYLFGSASEISHTSTATVTASPKISPARSRNASM